VCAVVASGPAFGYKRSQSPYLKPHALLLKTKIESRFSPMQWTFGLVVDWYCAVGDKHLATSPRCEDGALTLLDDVDLDARDTPLQQTHHARDLLAHSYPLVDGRIDAAEQRRREQRVAAHLAAHNGVHFAPYAVCPHVYAEYVDEFCRNELDAALAAVRCDVLLLWGSGDPARTMFGGAAALLAALPADTRRELVVVQLHSGTFDHLHDGMFPKRCACTMRRFIDSIDKQ
jgi:hypothetical protein